jgi:hypothetical protein
MAKITLYKLGAGAKAKAVRRAPGNAAAPPDFVLTVGTDGSFTVFGTDGTTQPDGSPTQIDISALATMSAVSSDPSKVTVKTNGMSGVETGVSPGTGIPVNVTVTITASGQIFNAVDTVDVVKAPPGPVTGLVIVHQKPTIA